MLTSNRARDFSILGLAAVLALLLTSPAPLFAQAEECSGWMVSCASVQVQAEGERLVFYVPNATVPADLGNEQAPEAAERLRVYASQNGMTCDPLSGAGCVDITEPWIEAADSGEPMVGSTATGALDPGNRSCEDEVEWMDAARGLSEEDRPRCNRPVAAYFIVALPAAAFLFGPDGDDPDVVLPIGEDPEVLSGDGADDGNSGSGDTGSGDGGSAGGTGSGGSDDGGSSGDSGSSGSDDGGSNGGDTGGGDTGGGDLGGEWPPGGGSPGGGATPGMGQVPEPVSTTLFGIGLLGYAGARLRQRRMNDRQEEDA